MGFEIENGVLVNYWEEYGITKVTIPNSVTSIGNLAFSFCESLTSITIPDSVTNIGYAAFSCCKSLISINIPENVTSIGDCAFSGCENLTGVIIPNNMTSIGAYAFSGCRIFTSIIIPDSVTSIGYGAFYACTSLTEIKVCENNNTYCDIDGVLFSKDKKTLLICPIGKAGDYSVPDGVTNIADNAFDNCINLSDLTININQHKFTINVAEIEKAKESLNNALNMILTKDFSRRLSHKVKFKLIMDYFFCTDDENAKAYIKKNFVKAMKQLIENGDVDRINKILEKTDFVTKRNIDKFIIHAADNQQQEIQTILTDYKNKIIPDKTPEEESNL